MFEALASGLGQVVQPTILLTMLVGMCIGFVTGILPGLGGPVTLAILLPFAFGMDPVQGFAFLIGIWIVTSTAGDITSVLFGIPGEPTSAAAVMDGYPLTRKGQSGRALGALLTSSALGGILGMIVLALTITLIRPLVLAIGPPEFFVLTVLGLTFVITLAGNNLLKGFIMASLGLLVAVVGIDPELGLPRYTFGSLSFWDGVDIIPIVIGLFGGAEVLQLMLSKRSISQTVEPDVNSLGQRARGILDALKHWSVIVRSSAIAIVIGMLPGLGGSVSQWLAYGHAKQTSKHPERFGKGAIDGVVAAGATSNAKDGGQLVPTIAFGIPGGAATAVLLGGLMILGLTPGAEMLTVNLDLTMSMVWIAVFANVIAVSIALLGVKYLSKLTHISGPVLIPAIVMLLMVGTYSVNNDYVDVFVMVGAAAIGVICLRWNWPRVPFLLAVVLGGFTESYLSLSSSMFGTEWLTRPGVLTLFAVIVGSLTIGALPSLRKWKLRREVSQESTK
ncbi:tripartite tricarboxylate transporter permease [Nesterenkonia sphaerica]|uniref:Tripartite tricarboxylate transporter permease n=1 Tax=Nesterenkonia sphaerica TaxID=1804988 RepID=A0A5R8ZZ69_9MICC|nr:tripartite tricarboxylate transporter permease [Nesterenkonia sphaerica]TLP71214.1 tripartite tricarboxylate transporter permease [Nesterenkonia sphaerica]